MKSFFDGPKMKMISDEKQIQHYAEDHAAIVNVLDNLREFAATMPAPEESEDQDLHVPGMRTADFEAVRTIRSLLTHAAAIADHFGK